MKRLILFFIPFLCLRLTGFCQHNCANPVLITICPDVYLTGQTNSGMLNDAPAACNIPGEDLVYKITVTNGADKLLVSLVNATMPSLLILEESTCGGLCVTKSAPAGNSDFSLSVNPGVNYYLWVDAAGTLTFDIAIGADTGSVFVNIPNTQGNLQPDSSLCGLPPFQPSKPFFQVQYNGTYKTHPMTLNPLAIPGIMCVSVFFKNTNGVEGVKRFDFDFNPIGYMNVIPVDSIPGFFNPGYWRANFSGTTWSYVFDDSAGIGRGDFTGVPDTCLKYEFCFTLTPLSNDPLLTNVDVLVSSDGYGAGFTGYVNSGCCPSPMINCFGSGGGGPFGAANSFGFGFADPGNPLPIQLINFTADPDEHGVILNWITATEINNDYFTIEKSMNGTEWLIVEMIDGAGTSSMPISYTYHDAAPFDGTSYYRLKQTDFDGTSAYSHIVHVTFKAPEVTLIFPLPADDHLIIQSGSAKNLSIQLFDIRGIQLHVDATYKENTILLNTSFLNSGLYLLIILEGGRVVEKSKVVVGRGE